MMNALFIGESMEATDAKVIITVQGRGLGLDLGVVV